MAFSDFKTIPEVQEKSESHTQKMTSLPLKNP